MNLFLVRSAATIGLATTLAACGAGAQVDMPYKAAALMQVNVQSGPAGVAAAHAAVSPSGSVQVANSNMPLPDCAADGCNSLRIIDANAEAYRYQAMQRAEAPRS